MNDSVSTHHQLRGGSRYPSVTIIWRKDSSWGGGGWQGTLSLWRSANEKDPHEHTVCIGQGAPLGSVTIMFDSVGYGAWEIASFEGVGVTERDLQWATLWAVLALKSRRAAGLGLAPLPAP